MQHSCNDLEFGCSPGLLPRRLETDSSNALTPAPEPRELQGTSAGPCSELHGRLGSSGRARPRRPHTNHSNLGGPGIRELGREVMQVAGVDLYVNHAVLHLGATDWVPVSLVLTEASAASCDTHVAVRVRPQAGLIKVRFFVLSESENSEEVDPSFTTIFDGSLILSDGRIAIGDVEQLSRFVYRVGDRGEFKVRVAVDSPGRDARAIDVMINRSSL